MEKNIVLTLDGQKQPVTLVRCLVRVRIMPESKAGTLPDYSGDGYRFIQAGSLAGKVLAVYAKSL